MHPVSPTVSLRACRRLHSRKERARSGRFLAEGIRPVTAALQAGIAIEAIVHAPDLLRGDHALAALELARRRNIPCLRLSPREFESLATRDRPQGIACVGRQAWSRLDHFAHTTAPIVALYAPQDPGNLGTILRTCDAAGCGGIILIGDAVDPWHPWALRAAMGATFSLPLVRCDVPAFVGWARGQARPLIGASDRAAADYAAYAFPESFVLLMGSERQGLPRELEAATETLVRIPMAGAADSLNLAVATALVIYEARNQRTRAGGQPEGRR
jgi:TrmH family RNA methyltransferase